MFGLFELYIKMFHEKGESAIIFFCKSTVAKNVFLSKYNKLEHKIDKMGGEEKKELKLYVNELFKNEPPQFRLDACKIIFCLNQNL